MEETCIFCRIIQKKIPAKIVHEDDTCMSFYDVNPKARLHLLMIPKKHLATLKDVDENDEPVLGHMMKIASDVAKKLDLADYKLKMSVGKKAGQVVFHIHLHLMSVD